MPRCLFIKGDCLQRCHCPLVDVQLYSILDPQPKHRWMAQLSEQLEAAGDVVDSVFFTHYGQYSAGAGLHLQASLINNLI